MSRGLVEEGGHGLGPAIDLLKMNGEASGGEGTVGVFGGWRNSQPSCRVVLDEERNGRHPGFVVAG